MICTMKNVQLFSVRKLVEHWSQGNGTGEAVGHSPALELYEAAESASRMLRSLK